MLSADAIAGAYSQFSDEYTIYVFDRARTLSNGYKVEDMADDTAMAMSELGIENAYVFGESQGGMIAMLIAIKHPNLIMKMVLGAAASIELADELKCELYMYDGGHAVYDEAPDYKDRIQDFFNK